MASVPAQVADISVDWLNEVLSGSVGKVESFTAEPLGQGVGILGELARLNLRYADDNADGNADGNGDGNDRPPTMIAKCQSPAPENQFLGRVMGFYLREVNFYRQVSEQLDVRVPYAYHADAGDEGLPFVLLLEDIVGARCPDQIAGLTPDEAVSILDVVARLHAEFWDDTKLDALPWLPPMNNPLYQAGKQMALDRWPAFEQRFGGRIEPGMLAAIKTACDHYGEMLDFVATQGQTTFTHTDCRAENYLFGGSAGEGVVTMVDFQLCTRHFGPWDVANLLGGSLTPDVRRACEHDLVERYHGQLVAHGVTNYSLDQCWRELRLSLLQMCTAVVIVSDLQGGNERGAELLENLTLRPIIAATDHRVHELLAEFC